MPISITRRNFLQGTLLAVGAGSFGAIRGFADEPLVVRDPDCFALLSDIHIPGDRTTVTRDVNPVDTFRTVYKEVLASPVRPQNLIVSGDCVHLYGKPEDYKTLMEEIAPVLESDVSVHFVMGNHDNRDVFLEACVWTKPRKSERPVENRQISVLETPKANWFLLDSLVRTNYTPGKMDSEQLEWLAKELDERNGKPAILVAHHNLVNDDDPETHGLQDSGAFWKTIKDRKQVKAYVYGHTHVWKTQIRDGVHLINVPATAWKFLGSEPTGWVLAKLSEKGISLELCSLDKTHKKHAQKLDLVWR